MTRTKLTLASDIPATDRLDLKEGQREIAIIAIIAITAILPRAEGDARPLDAGHVVTLAESMAPLGLLEPIVVDLEGHLLAGAHRLAALQMLAISDGEERRKVFLTRMGITQSKPPKKPKQAEGAVAAQAEDAPKIPASVEALAKRLTAIDSSTITAKYGTKFKVPVTVVNTSEKAGKALDLVVEAAENGIRRQYSNDEIRGLAVKLKKAGYTHREGRPRSGEKAMIVALESIVGKSTKHLKRILGETEAKEETPEWDLALKALGRIIDRVLEAGKLKRSEKANAIKVMVKTLQESLAAGAEDESE